jgi:hypothetical protein
MNSFVRETGVSGEERWSQLSEWGYLSCDCSANMCDSIGDGGDLKLAKRSRVSARASVFEWVKII